MGRAVICIAYTTMEHDANKYVINLTLTGCVEDRRVAYPPSWDFYFWIGERHVAEFIAETYFSHNHYDRAMCHHLYLDRIHVGQYTTRYLRVYAVSDEYWEEKKLHTLVSQCVKSIPIPESDAAFRDLITKALNNKGSQRFDYFLK